MSIQPNDSVRKTSSNKVSRQAGLYALAAAAAGVSLLAMVQPAAGEVIVTKKTIPIPLTPDTMQKPVHISMANNGVDNFTFILQTDGSSRGLRELDVLGVDPGQGNQFLEGGDFYGKALALQRGVTIGPAGITSANFFSSALVEGTNSSKGVFYSRGYWGGNPKNKYLGVRFNIDGETHYGWIRLTVTSDTQSKKPSLEATITGYAYESVANKAIKAGSGSTAVAEVSAENTRKQAGPSLGMLAAGSEGMPEWRREETSVRP